MVPSYPEAMGASIGNDPAKALRRRRRMNQKAARTPMRREIPAPRPTSRPTPRVLSLLVSPVGSGGAEVAEESDWTIVDVLDGERVTIVISVTL